MRRLIREQDPPRPSTRLSALGPARTSVAADRRTEPRRLRSELRGDLDWIVMKALEKDRNRRYDSPLALAGDIRRHLNHEPVAAGPPSAVYRTRKFVRRHRLGVGAAVATLAVLVTFAGAMTVQARRIALERNRAEAGFQQAREAVDQYLTTVSETKLLDVPGLEPLRRELLESALAYHQRFLAQNADDPAVRRELADSYRRVGSISRLMGDNAASLAALEHAVDLLTSLLAEHPDAGDDRFALCEAQSAAGFMLHELGRLDEAVTELDEAKAGGDRLLASDPANRNYRRFAGLVRSNLGVVHRSAQHADLSRSNLEEARDIVAGVVAEQPDDLMNLDLLSLIQLNLGTLYVTTGGDALGTLEAARGGYQTLHRARPTVAEYRENLALTRGNLGRMLLNDGDVADALVELQASVDLLADLSGSSPEVIQYRDGWVRSCLMLSDAQRAAGQVDAAFASSTQARGLLDDLLAARPQDADIVHSLAKCHSNLGRLLALRGDREAALAEFTRSVGYLERVEGWGPDADYNRACYLALSVPLVPRDPARPTAAERARQDALAAEAVAALHRAVADGMTYLEWYQLDTDLDPLRERADFQAFLADLAASQSGGVSRTGP
ncbi:MAG: hypothetical protein R3D98_10285 [Candidatus Krumholzibacteriia bacterium]